MVTGSKVYDSFKISDDQVTPENTEGCHLAIQLESNTFCWCLTTLNDGKVVELGRMAFDEASDGMFRQKYGSASAALQGGPQTMVPQSLFDEARAADLLSPGDKNQEVRFVSIQDPYAMMVFPEKSSIESELLDAIPGLIVKPNLGWSIHSVMKKNRFDRPPQLYVDIAQNTIEVIAVAHKELLLANSFSIASDEDTLYHISNVMKVLGLDNQETNVFLSGDIEVSGKRFELFRKYLHHPEVNFGFSMPRMAVALSSVKKQNFVSLFNQFACVS